MRPALIRKYLNCGDSIPLALHILNCIPVAISYPMTDTTMNRRRNAE